MSFNGCNMFNKLLAQRRLHRGVQALSDALLKNKKIPETFVPGFEIWSDLNFFEG